MGGSESRLGSCLEFHDELALGVIEVEEAYFCHILKPWKVGNGAVWKYSACHDNLDFPNASRIKYTEGTKRPGEDGTRSLGHWARP